MEMNWLNDQPEKLNNGRFYWLALMVLAGLGVMA